jgi:hypothetical protein
VLALHQAVLELELVQQVVPQVVFGEYSGIAKNDETILGTSECDVESTRVIQEPDPRGFIAPYAGEQNEVLLPALETVHGCYLDLLV